MTIRVTVAVARPDLQEVVELELPEGSTLSDAIAACGASGLLPGVECSMAGIWSRPASADTVLRDNDRVELYRPLKADAKAQRRHRARLKPASPRSRNGP